MDTAVAAGGRLRGGTGTRAVRTCAGEGEEDFPGQVAEMKPA